MHDAMTGPAVLPFAADVATTYKLVEPHTPCLTGNRLWLANKLSRTPLAGYLFRMMAARAGLDKVLWQQSYPEEPALCVVPPISATPEPLPTTPLAQPDPNARLAALVTSLGEHGLSVVATSNVNRPAIRDYHWAYSNGHLTPTQVAQRIIAFLEQHNATQGWLTAWDKADILGQAAASSARYAAGSPLGVLDGVPYAVKDNLDALPYATSSGTSFMASRRTVLKDCPSVAALRPTGAVLVGKAAMHEIGVMPFGTNAAQGGALHPNDPTRLTGGSSSGSAALVAAGLVPFSLANDGGGSVRIPAALCGVVGLKPTHGRLQDDAAHLGHFSTLVTTGVIALSSIDAALVYAVVAALAPQQPHPVPPFEVPGLLTANGVVPPPVTGVSLPSRMCPFSRSTLSTASEKPLTGLRVGVFDPWFDHATPAMATHCRKQLGLLKDLGATLVPVSLPELEEGRVAHMATFVREMAEAYGDVLADPVLEQQLGADTQLFFINAKHLSDADYVAAQRIRARLASHFRAAFQVADVIVTPTTPCAAPLVPPGANSYGLYDLRLASSLVRFCQPANLLGLPALTLPAGRLPGGALPQMPVGLQLIGRHWQEATLLGVAAALEAQLEDVFVPRPLPSLHTNPLWMAEHPVAKRMADKFKAVQAAERAERAAAAAGGKGKKSMWE